MKKIVVAVLAFSSVFASYARDFNETVYFKNGSVVKGSIDELEPGKSFKIETKDGSVIVANLTEVEKIELNTHKKNNIYGLDRGYRGFVQGEYVCANYWGGGATTIHGAQLNNHWFVGGGIGLRIDTDNENCRRVPMFADVRYEFKTTKVAPFIDVRAGIENELYYNTCSLYGTFGGGLRIGRFDVGAGVEYSEKYTREGYLNSDGQTECYGKQKYVASFYAKIGFSF